MKRTLYIAFLILILIALILIPNKTKAEAPSPTVAPKPTYQQLKQYSVVALAEHFATEYKVPPQIMKYIINCESTYDVNAHKYTPTGPHREDSWGIAQINLFAHPHITKAQATDKVFAAEFLAKGLADGKGAMWATCYTKSKLIK
jgi:hypothetical protein